MKSFHAATLLVVRLTLFRIAFVALILGTAGCAETGNHAHEIGTVDMANGAVDDQSEIAVNIDRYLRAMEAMGFSGAIIVDAGGKIVLRKGYGLADRQAGHPYTPATVQTHGSITKQMTGAAILLLEFRGHLSVGDTIDEYFDGVPEDRRNVTIHQLMTHSSGLPGSIGRDNEPISAEAFTERAMATPLDFEPGTGYSYSNVGYSLLGIIVERVSGKTYETFLHEELLLPAGLAETGYLLPDWDPERLAVGYQGGERWGRVHQRQWREDGPGWHLRANGGLHTTVDDMHRWLETVRGRGVLPEDAAIRWTTGYVDEGGGDSKYAYGWAVHDAEAGPMVAHNGGNGIFSADFVWLPEQAFFLYIQGNTSVVPAARQRDALLAAAFDPEFEMPPLVSGSNTAKLETAKAREGQYWLDEGSITLEADDTRLIAMLSGQNALDLMLGHGEDQRNRFDGLNRRAMEMVRKLEAGREDAMKGMVGVEEDAVARARSMLNVIERGGELKSLTLVGSIANVPGSRFADYGPWTTFVRAEFDQLIQMWSVLWHEDGTYRGTAIGPSSDVPSLILVPIGDDRYTGVRREPPWDTADIQFVDGCLVAADLQACRAP
ncbi:beta-lactamase family protein [Wenzhouxiangella sp. XN201]|uniref:serine hydrolase domain-containing protein n=1 Tax=Wenzhouxiangella sp. XN201 TaxID=2710755 RepID=UPI0013CD244E|nr:serine hydrolase domain-containing protein [Wenzhouxiangella sp. XN201]NEZ04932.1 beta-lactamase family protein [Wenzhouxiangella sp. XN201]